MVGPNVHSRGENTESFNRDLEFFILYTWLELDDTADEDGNRSEAKERLDFLIDSICFLSQPILIELNISDFGGYEEGLGPAYDGDEVYTLVFVTEHADEVTQQKLSDIIDGVHGFAYDGMNHIATMNNVALVNRTSISEILNFMYELYS